MKIAIIGPGAVGKTTIIKYLEEDLKEFEFIYERQDIINENFGRYMEDMHSNAFEMQKNFFAYRKEEIKKLNNLKNGIIDRHLIDDFIFPQVHIEVNNFTEEEANY
jgi:nicotinamide mononucleotide transporter